MAVEGGPSIVQDSLIAYWDAGNSKSYPGTGTTWFDLSGNNHHAYGDPNATGSGSNSANFPTWSSADGGRFEFSGTKAFTVLTDMGTNTALTADWWCYRTNTNSSLYFFDGRNDGGTYWITNYQSHNIDIGNTLKVNSPSTYTVSSNWWLKWTHFVLTSNGTENKLWVDGQEITAGFTVNNPINKNLGQYFRIGTRYTSQNYWPGYFSNIKFYNRVLTDDEIIQNYEALKGRFQ